MRITSLSVRQFRNISSLELEPHPVLNLFIGDNGQGKTSLIESLFFISTLRSFRTGKTTDLIQKDKTGFQVQTDVKVRNENNFSLKVRVEDKTRTLSVGEKKLTASNFVTRLKTIVFSPESLGSIKSGPEARRDLIDQAVFQTSEKGALSQQLFSRVLRQRNACLRQIRDGDLSSSHGVEVLESLEPTYLQAASDVIETRLTLLDSLFSKMGDILGEITGEARQISFVYKSGDKAWKERTSGHILDRLRSELTSTERLRAELALGATLTGPHRHDLSFLFDGNDSRIFCSQGQQRALILAFKIAEIVYHGEVLKSYPLLLLDDVLSEFDEQKRRYLVDFLRKNEAQTFLTTTEKTRGLESEAQAYKVFQVASGNVASLPVINV